MFLAIILFLVGLVALLVGAKLFVLGAAQLALTLKISSLVVGLTIVSFGTSAPELGVSIAGAWKEKSNLIVGNIVGSNIFNILLVLGFCAIVTPLIVRKQLIWWDVPFMILSTLLFWLLVDNGQLGRIDGGILFAGMVVYFVFAFVFLKKQPPEEKHGVAHHPIWLQLVWIVIGLILLVVGSELLIINASKIALYLGISELLIGLTIVAVGTSLPELATSFIAALKKENDLAVGNVVGSNIFNLLGVMGITGLISPKPIMVPPKAVLFDMPVLVGISIASFPIFLTGHRISRWEGCIFLFYYFLYVLFLVLKAEYVYYLSYFTTAFFFFILPLTVLTIFIGLVRHFRRGS